MNCVSYHQVLGMPTFCKGSCEGGEMEWESNCSMDDSAEAANVCNIGIWATNGKDRGREAILQRLSGEDDGVGRGWNYAPCDRRL